MSLAQPDAAVRPRPAVSAWPDLPYRGLDFYREEDAPLLVGRDSDADACGARLTHSATRLLLLQGTTGAGKTSFLRAALCPWLAETGDFWVLRDAEGWPTVLRSTDAPLERLRAALLVAVEDPAGQLRPLLGRRAESVLRVARDHLNTDATTPDAAGYAVERALREITAVLPRTLVLIVDQAEEVFTLQSGRAGEAERRAYFGMLRRFCRFGAGLRVLLALRTEYFGEFCDAFGQLPDGEVSTVRSGYVQYALRGLALQEELTAVIERPTLDAPVEGHEALGPPRRRYSFHFRPGDAARIATDVLAYAGREHVGALPVLQVVCRELWDRHVRTLGLHPASGIVRELTYEDYRALGNVAGALERHVENGIAAALQTVGLPAPPKAVARWQYVLSALAAEHDGGATGSLVLPEQELLDAARDAGLRKASPEVLRRLTEGASPLLRSVAGGEGRRYSLRHDVVAVCLARTRQAFAQKRRYELHKAWWFWTGAGAVLVALLLGGLAVYLAYAPRKAEVDRIQAFASLDGPGDYRLRTLLLLRALDAAGLPEEFENPQADRRRAWRRAVDGASRVVMGREEALRGQLTELLLRAPLPDPHLRAAGGDAAGSRLVLYQEGDDKAWLQVRAADGTLATVCEVQRPNRQEQGVVRIAAGFLRAKGADGAEGPELPALVSLELGGGPGASAPPVLRVQPCREGAVLPVRTDRLAEALAAMARQPPPPYLELAGGAIRLTQFELRPSGPVQATKLLALRLSAAEDGALSVDPVTPLPVKWQGTHMAVTSPCNRYASVDVPNIAGDSVAATLVLRHLSDQASDIQLGADARPRGTRPIGDGLAFSPDCRWLGYRPDILPPRSAERPGSPAPSRFFVYGPLDPKDGGDIRVEEIGFPAELNSAQPPQILSFRPNHALALAQGGEFRMAWYLPSVPNSETAVEHGLAVVAWRAGASTASRLLPPRELRGEGARGQPPPATLLGGRMEQSPYSRLFFAANGTLLIAENDYFDRQDPRPRIRVWTLDYAARREALNQLTLIELRREACRVAATEAPRSLSNQFTPSELQAWFADRNASQPCRREDQAR
jgi:hypothetical protein